MKLSISGNETFEIPDVGLDEFAEAWQRAIRKCRFIRLRTADNRILWFNHLGIAYVEGKEQRFFA
jgi:hypothetical protein